MGCTSSQPAAAAAPPPPPPQAPTSPGGDPFAALTGLPATGADKHFQATAGRTGPAFVPQQHATPAYAQQQQLRQQQMQAHAQMAYLQQQQQALAMQQRALAGGAPHPGQPGLMMMPGLAAAPPMMPGQQQHIPDVATAAPGASGFSFMGAQSPKDADSFGFVSDMIGAKR